MPGITKHKMNEWKYTEYIIHTHLTHARTRTHAHTKTCKENHVDSPMHMYSLAQLNVDDRAMNEGRYLANTSSSRSLGLLVFLPSISDHNASGHKMHLMPTHCAIITVYIHKKPRLPLKLRCCIAPQKYSLSLFDILPYQMLIHCLRVGPIPQKLPVTLP